MIKKLLLLFALNLGTLRAVDSGALRVGSVVGLFQKVNEKTYYLGYEWQGSRPQIVSKHNLKVDLSVKLYLQDATSQNRLANSWADIRSGETKLRFEVAVGDSAKASNTAISSDYIGYSTSGSAVEALSVPVSGGNPFNNSVGNMFFLVKDLDFDPNPNIFPGDEVAIVGYVGGKRFFLVSSKPSQENAPIFSFWSSADQNALPPSDQYFYFWTVGLNNANDMIIDNLENKIFAGVQSLLGWPSNLVLKKPSLVKPSVPLKFGDAIVVKHKIHPDFYLRIVPNDDLILNTRVGNTDIVGTVGPGEGVEFDDSYRWFIRPGNTFSYWGRPSKVDYLVRSGDFVFLTNKKYVSPNGRDGILTIASEAPNKALVSSLPATRIHGSSFIHRGQVPWRIYKKNGEVGLPINSDDEIYFVRYVDTSSGGYPTPSSMRGYHFLGSSNNAIPQGHSYLGNTPGCKEVFGMMIGQSVKPNNFEQDYLWKVAEATSPRPLPNWDFGYGVWPDGSAKSWSDHIHPPGTDLDMRVGNYWGGFPHANFVQF